MTEENFILFSIHYDGFSVGTLSFFFKSNFRVPPSLFSVYFFVILYRQLI
jgi:hypothetical protein